MSFFSRLCKSGMVSWGDITSGKVGIRQCYEIALMIDWQDMSGQKANMVAAQRHG